MATVLVSWATQDEVIPNAASFTQYDIAIKNAAGAVVAEALEPIGNSEHSFLNIAAGDYVAVVELVDPAGTLGAPPVSAAFTVPAEPTAAVPVSVSVSLG